MVGLFTIGQKRERVVVWIGLHWHGGWIRMGLMVDGGRGKYVRCTLYYCLVLHIGLACAWSHFLFVSCLCNWDYLD